MLFEQRLDDLGAAAPALLGAALRGGAFADLFYEHTFHDRLTLRHEAGRVPRWMPRRHVAEGAAVRVLDDFAEGFSATGDLSLGALRAAADAAAAQLGSGGTGQAQPLNDPTVYLDLPPDAPEAVSDAEKRALLLAAAEAAFGLDERVEQVEVSYRAHTRRVALATSEGWFGAKATLLLGLRVAVTLRGPDGPATAHALAGGPEGFGQFFATPPAPLAREAVERAQQRIEARALPPGALPVVLGSGWGGAWLHEAVGHLVEADVVARGGSPFAGCLGERVAGPAVTLVDDSTCAGGRATAPFDDEGTPAARTVLLGEGVLRTFLADRRYARRLGLRRGGNARRQDYRHPPLPRMTNLLLLGGTTPPADLLADVPDGLYVQHLGHGFTHPGGFALDVLDGFRIERGRLGAPVAGVRLVGEGAAALRSLVGLGDDFRLDVTRGQCKKAGQVVPVAVGMPTVLLRRLDVVPIR